MEIVTTLIDFILHLDKHLEQIIQDYGLLTYAILFLIIFVETGVVVLPFLPGDSLLFAAGMLAANEKNGLSVGIIIVLLIVAAILGDTLNYIIGKYIGPKVFSRDYKLLKKEHLLKTQQFYDKHGGKTIIYARFIPIIRTFAPFVAGIGNMKYGKFINYNIIGGIVWVVLFTMAGYLFGNIEIVKSNFTKIILGIIIVSLLPAVIEIIKGSKKTSTSLK
jgi:membrane-associated protein